MSFFYPANKTPRWWWARAALKRTEYYPHLSRKMNKREGTVAFLFRDGRHVAGQDSEKLFGLFQAFQIEVVPTDDTFGIAGLQGCFALRPEFCHKHRNERVPHHVVSGGKFYRDFFTDVLKVCGDDRELGQRVVALAKQQFRDVY